MDEKKLYLNDVVDASMQAILSLLVAELQEPLNSIKLSDRDKVIEVQKILHHWIQGSNLTPQKVRTMPQELADQFKRGEVGFDAIFNFMKGS